jgi:hypothetical protein
MKKIFAIALLALFIISCNEKKEESKVTTTDTLSEAGKMDAMGDSAKRMMDRMGDSANQMMDKMGDSAKKMMDAAAEKMEKKN